MPQLLYYLRKESDGAKQIAFAGGGTSQIKAAMEQADSWIEQAPPEMVPPDLVEARDGATRAVQERLFSSKTVEWGVVAVYTCTNSCNPAATGCGDSDAIPADSEGAATAIARASRHPPPDLGACAEEYAWVQPPLDA
jgi:hypothetical protein